MVHQVEVAVGVEAQLLAREEVLVCGVEFAELCFHQCGCSVPWGLGEQEAERLQVGLFVLPLRDSQLLERGVRVNFEDEPFQGRGRESSQMVLALAQELGIVGLLVVLLEHPIFDRYPTRAGLGRVLREVLHHFLDRGLRVGCLRLVHELSRFVRLTRNRRQRARTTALHRDR